MTKMVTFWVDGAEYALPEVHVEQVLGAPRLTRVPHPATHFDGLLNWRGRIVPVLNLRKWLGLPAGFPADSACVILVRGGDDVVGIRVDVLGGEANAMAMPDDSETAQPLDLGDRRATLLPFAALFDLSGGAGDNHTAGSASGVQPAGRVEW
jgi:purine-binding chemotaxis protein CheW